MRNLLFRNNNQAVMKKLTKKMYQANRNRNLFLICTIILTSFLFTSVFSLGMGYMESLRMRTLRMEGSMSHVAFSAPSIEQLDKVLQLPYVKHVGLGYMIGECEETLSIGTHVQLAHVNETQWETMFLPIFTEVEGEFPKNEQDIALSRFILAEMGIEQPYLGMKIPMTFVIYGTQEKVTEVFELCGIYTEYSHLNPNVSLVGYTSYALAEKYEKNSLEQTIVNIMFSSDKNISEQIEKLGTDLNFREQQQCVASPTYTEQKTDKTAWIVLACVVTVLMLAGYLLIYNVMHISITNDIQFYGMLKTIGTTPNQIKQLLIRQMNILCLVGLPIGMLIGALVSMYFVPVIIQNSGVQIGTEFSFSPWIYIGTALFTWITVYLGAVEAAYIASKISPIEARKYTGVTYRIKPYFLKKGRKQFQMAVRNMLRQKRRVSVVLISLSMGMMLFLLMTTILASWDIDKKVLDEYEHDISITASGVQGHRYLEKDFLDKISQIQGIAQMQMRTLTGGKLEYDATLDAYVDYEYDKCVALGLEVDRETVKEKGLGFGIRGIDLPQMQQLCQEQGISLDEKAWVQGDFCLIYAGGISEDILESSFATGTDVTLILGSGNEKRQMAIGGYIELSFPPTGFTVSYGDVELVVANEFLKEKGICTEIVDAGFFVEEGMEEQVNLRIKQMLTAKQLFVSRLEAKQECEQSRLLLYIVGGCISGILAFIGICNFVNVISVGILARKQELAMLECIGMSKREIRQMVTYEGGIYALLSIFITTTVGNIFTYRIFVAFQKAEQTAEFTYPYVAVVFLYIVIIGICVTVPAIIWNQENRKSLVERMQET